MGYFCGFRGIYQFVPPACQRGQFRRTPASVSVVRCGIGAAPTSRAKDEGAGIGLAEFHDCVFDEERDAESVPETLLLMTSKLFMASIY